MVVFICTRALTQNLFVADYGSGNIYEFTPGGAQSTFASGLNYPDGLAFNSAGDLFEADHGSGNIYEFTPGGAQSTFASGLNSPVGLAFDSAGDLFVADFQRERQQSMNSRRAERKAPLPPGGGSIAGLAFDSAGNLFCVGFPVSGAIFEFTPGGGQSTFASGLQDPCDMAFDSAGNLFVADQNSGKIYEFTPGGAMSTFASGLALPTGLAFDSAGNLFVADNGNGNIYKFTPGGARSTFASGLNGPLALAFQPVPDLVAVLTNGVFQVSVSMPSPYYSTIIQTSTNLVNWVSIYTNTPPFTFTNSMATTSAQCFYRAVLGP